MTTHLETITRLSVDGQVMSQATRSLAIDASVDLENLSLNGSVFSGDVVVKADIGIGTIQADFPFSFDAGVSNPVVVELGEIDTPIGTIEVDAEFSADIANRTVCAAVTLAGLLSIAKVCKTF